MTKVLKKRIEPESRGTRYSRDSKGRKVHYQPKPKLVMAKKAITRKIKPEKAYHVINPNKNYKEGK